MMVDSGGAAGTIALYVFSSSSGKLQVVYRNQRLYRALVNVNPGPALAYSVPLYSAGDELCCPAAYRETTLEWSAKRSRFGVARRRTVNP